MPYVKNFSLQLPADDTVIWRYMDFWKYEKLIADKAIFFARTDQMKDTWDSQLPMHWLSAASKSTGISRPEGNATYSIREWYIEQEIPSNPICCFHMNAEESERMWKGYTEQSSGIVIKSTIERLVSSVSDTAKEVYIGVVQYGEENEVGKPHYTYSTWEGEKSLPTNPWYVPRFLKRDEFDFEKELRVTTHFSQADTPYDKGRNLVLGVNGLLDLIEEVRLAPGTDKSMLQRIDQLHISHGLQSISVKQSSCVAKRE